MRRIRLPPNFLFPPNFQTLGVLPLSSPTITGTTCCMPALLSSPSGLVPMKILALSAPVMSLRQSKICCFVCSSSTMSARLKHILQLTCDHEDVAAHGHNNSYRMSCFLAGGKIMEIIFGSIYLYNTILIYIDRLSNDPGCFVVSLFIPAPR
jgi:hypothetical protein